MPYCVNCRQDYPEDVGADVAHEAPCRTCASDGHAACQCG